MSVSARLALLGLVACVACRGPEPPATGETRVVHDDLYAVAVATAEHVVAVGDRGAVRVSGDGGASWQAGEASTRRPLYAVSLADASVGWAVGAYGLILRTDDGGHHWTHQAHPEAAEGSHLFGVHALDADRAIAVGAWGARIRTTDGGRSWTDHSLVVGPSHPQFVWLSEAEQAAVRDGHRIHEDTVLQDVTCWRGRAGGGAGEGIGADRCWTVGEFGSVYRSDDAGVSWRAAEIRGAGRHPVLFGVGFADASHGLVSGLGGLVLRSRDGGRHWDAVRVEPARALFAVSAGGGRAVAVGEGAEVRISTDGGRRWTSAVAGAGAAGFLRDLAFAPGRPHTTGFAVGQAGRILRTRDGGASWSRVHPGEGAGGHRSPSQAWVESRGNLSSRQLDRPMP